MLNTRTLADYRRIRKYGASDSDCSIPYSAKLCLAIAKSNEKARDYPLQYDGDSYETDYGFTVTLKAEFDDIDPFDGDTYGEISQCSANDYRNGIEGWRLDDSHMYFPNKHHTFADRLAQCRKFGMSRNVAYLAALNGLQKEAEHWQSLQNDRYGNYGQCLWLCVTVTRDGEEYGEDSIGGCWITDSYTVAHFLAGDYPLDEYALQDARKAWQAELTCNARQMEQSRPDMYAP